MMLRRHQRTGQIGPKNSHLCQADVKSPNIPVRESERNAYKANETPKDVVQACLYGEDLQDAYYGKPDPKDQTPEAECTGTSKTKNQAIESTGKSKRRGDMP